MARQPKGRPSIYQGADGLHHCYLTVGTKPDGSPLRKHFKRKTAALVLAAVEEYQDRQRRGAGVAAKVETVEQWLTHWVHTILQAQVGYKKISYGTWRDYEKVVRIHAIPNLGQWRLAGTKRRLEPEHVEAAYVTLLAGGMAPSYVKKCHRVLTLALKVAYRRGKADRNVMDLVDPPEFSAKKVDSLTLLEAQAVLKEALTDRLAARWALAIIAGPRQGEALGIRWSHVHLDPEPPDVPHVKPTTQIQRRTWRHGCEDPAACAAPHCRRKACNPLYEHGCDDPSTCKKLARFCPARTEDAKRCHRHLAKSCPPLCPPRCTDHARACPSKVGGGLVEQELKSDASSEAIALGGLVAELFRQHREQQIRERAACAMEWDPDGFVFADFNGKPIDPRRDYGNWCEVVKRAGVKHHRLHAARHTTGTFLRATGSDLKMIKDVLRHAHLSTSEVYVDVAMEAKRDAVDRVAAALMEGDLSMILGAKRVA